MAALVGLLCGFVLISRITGALQETESPRLSKESVSHSLAQGGTDATAGEPDFRIAHATIVTGGATFNNGGLGLVGQPITGKCAEPAYTMVVGSIHGLLAPLFGDFDRNRRVNLRDYRDFALCLSGPETAADPTCARGDGDHDTDVDLKDIARFQEVFSGDP
jgi:hypothetical protein